MKFKVGDVVVFKVKHVFSPSGRREDMVESVGLQFGIIDSIHEIESTDGRESYYLLGSVKIQESDIISKVLTEKV